MLPVIDEVRGAPTALGPRCEVYYEILVVL